DLTAWLVGVGGAVYLVVMAALLYALRRGRGRADAATGPAIDRRMAHWVAGAVGATALILLCVLGYSFATGRALAAFAEPDALSIRVAGHQWWWEVEYEDPVPARRALTANEIW